MARVSIIITCYNLGSYLEEALEGALAQTYDDTEVVLVDDGSTDQATIQVIDRLPTYPNLRVLRTPNQGVARARNYGISNSTGAYILPLDADDRIMPTYLERAIAILDQQPEVGFVGAHYRIFGEREGECRPLAYTLPDLLVENVVPIASVFRRSCWEEVGGYCPEVRFEDWDLWLSILGRGHKAAVIPELLFHYRIRPQSRHMQNSEPEVYHQTLALIYQRHRALYEQHMSAVLCLKDRQFAHLQAHTLWLEQQVRNWQQAVQEHRDFIASLDQRTQKAARRHAWWNTQRERVRRTLAAEQGLHRKLWALAQKTAQVIWRRARRIRPL